MSKKTILLLAANPKDTTRLRLDEEFNAIFQVHRGSRLRDEFLLKLVVSASQKNIRQAILDHKPYIVHFSGHGTKASEIVIAKDDGSPHVVTPDALGPFFEIFSSHLRCVVLNSCFTAPLAKKVSEHVAYAVGMKKGLDDGPAIEYAAALYDGLFGGLAVEDAHQLGRNGILFSGNSGHSYPALYIGNDAEVDSQEAALDGLDSDSLARPLSSWERLQQAKRLDAARTRWDRLFLKRNALQKSSDLETRGEEKMRLEPLTTEVSATLSAVEEELRAIISAGQSARQGV